MGRVGVRVREAPAGPDLCSLARSGVVLKGVGQTGFSSQVRTVTFQDVPASYKPGIPFQGKVAGPVRVLPAARLCRIQKFVVRR